MNLAVLLASDTPNPQALPAAWPVECRELGDSTTLPSDGKAWQLMTLDQFNSHVAQYESEKAVWNETNENTEIEWSDFSNALSASSLGQRIVAATPPNSVAAVFIGALAARNTEIINTMIPSLVATYSITADEKAAFNVLVDTYHVPLNHM